MTSKWWQSSVVYQIYPRSFMDSNGDGIGDIQGILSKLDYLEYLGIDVIWLSPVYESPNEDNGYDISDYYQIMKDFGSMRDMDQLIAESNEKGIRIIMDLVANHTSTKHQWFQEAISSRDNYYHDYYVFRDQPNAVESIFLGSAWKENTKTNDFYLHMFSENQADLNWDNSNVRKEIYKMVNWWLDKGIGGFRLDVIDMISKDVDKGITANGEHLHEYIKELTRETFSKYDVLTVGETWGATAEKAKMFSNRDGSEFSMIFNFSHILLDQEENKEKWDFNKICVKELRDNLANQQIQLHNKGWNSLFWNNHDLPRIVSRWGNDTIYRVESAKMFAIISHFMQGTPYIYQGEELGMTNIHLQSIEDYQDIETLNMYDQRLAKGVSKNAIMNSIYKIGRDNARTPMQWTGGKNAGFTEGIPWIKCNSNAKYINVESQRGNPNSVLELYRMLIKLRRSSELSECIRDGSFELLMIDNEDVIAYRRNIKNTSLVVIANFSENETKIEMDFTGEVVVHNYTPVQSIKGKVQLKPYEAMCIIEKEGE